MSENESDFSETSASRASSATASELRRTLESINLNAPRRLMQQNSVAPAQPYNPPSVLAWLVGTWKGKGKGVFPTIKDFDYVEDCTFEWDETSPRPLLFYRQKTFSTKGNPPLPMHMESGYVRVIALPGSSAAKIEFIVSAPNGVSTTEEGTIEGHIINLKLTSTTRSSTSRPPVTTGLERTYTYNPDAVPPTLHCVVDMATSNTPALTRHLECMLTKWTDDITTDDEHGP